MSAQIVTFPMPRSGMRRPEVLTQEVHHLDLAALKLKDRGWAAKAGVISERNYRIETPVLSTNAPDIEVTAALVHAYDDLCGFLVEVFDCYQDDLPDRADFQPIEMRDVLSQFPAGKIYGYA